LRRVGRCWGERPERPDVSAAEIGKEMAADGVVRLANDPRSNKSTSGPMIGDRTADAVSAVVVPSDSDGETAPFDVKVVDDLVTSRLGA